MVTKLKYENILILIFSLISLTAVIMAGKLPLFWDMGFASIQASFIYEEGIRGLLLPSEIICGNPPGYAIYLAMLWKIFGKTLMVSHLAIMPFVFILIYFYIRFCSHFLKNHALAWAAILLLIDPAISTQIIYLGYDIAMLSLFTAGLYALYKQKTLLFILATFYIPLLNARGFSVVISLFIADFFIKQYIAGRYLKFNALLKYLPAFFVFILWHLYDYLGQGFLSNPHKYIYVDTFSLDWMIKNSVFIIWKAFDFGRVFIIPVILLLLFISFGNNIRDKKVKLFAGLCIAAILPYYIFFMPFRYPVGQRYFLQIFAVLIPFTLYLLQNYRRLVLHSVAFFLFSMLLAGNFWLYPEKYGNGWDASLKSIPYFGLREELNNDIIEMDIPFHSVAAEFPLFRSSAYTNLDDRNIRFTHLGGQDIDEFEYIIDSNISNTFRLDSKERLKNEWELLKEYRKGLVYLKFYRNPLIKADKNTD